MTISSFSPPREESFEGYAFVGTDFVAGSEGFSRFRASGGDVGPGADGCYALLRRTGTTWEAGTDARGLRKLFLYREGAAWALGTSLHDLARHLRAHGVDLTPDLAVLRGLGVRQALTAQLNSSRTIFRHVSLMPSFCTIRIQDGAPVVQPLPRASAPDDYEDALGEHLRIWRARLATVMTDPRTTFITDLSGGLDSRVVFAFAHAAGLLRDPARVQIASQERMATDFRAAGEIARRFDVTLNGPPMPMRTATSPEHALSAWAHHSLGVYLPVYLTPHAFDPLSIRCHGGGGGTFRDIFSSTSLRDRLLGTRKHFTDAATFERYASTVLEDAEALSAMRPEIDPQKLHYREFRNRFHFGHAPQTRTTFSPLNSILIDAIADRPGADDRRTYFDMMDALAPGLKNAPYDDPAKAPEDPSPSASARRAARLPAADPGGVFADLHEGTADRGHQRRAFSLFYDRAAEALERPEVQEAIGDHGVVARTGRFLRDVRRQSSRPRANDPGHQDASYVLTAALAAGAPLDL
ncbi:hypothetical protein DEO23_05665 [Brachybacterium endophyticum]|uniref:Asparagine synthetase domain-containing protein n=1 Tax=Brachybacterium endophyticum TaxID=2182385 RepID=A0A2U2RKR4_9MICO|nr:hypothetical protein [Brachybacterium endophyticum]PWH06457.1 hypothetical protein DEO23_05665 [Brachybacterium endophyticum]